MSLLARYALGEFLKVLSVTLLGATLLMILVGVMKEAIQQGLGLWQVFQLLPYVVPEALRFAVPATTLFAACSVYGRFSSSNEIVAVKAMGINPLVLLWPVVIASFLISIGAIWLNDVAVSWGRLGIRRVIVESVEEIAYGMLRTQKSYSTSRFSVNVKHVEDRMLIGPTITYQPSPDKPRVTMTAEYARLLTDPTENALIVELHNSTTEFGDGMKATIPDTVTRAIPLPDATNSRTEAAGPSQLALASIPGEKVRQLERVNRREQELAARAAFQMLTGDFAGLTSHTWFVDLTLLRDERARYHRLETEPHRRWANGFSCLCFVLVGAPLAIRLRNSDFLTSFFLCFVPILIVYYPLLAYGVDRAKSGSVPPYTVWLGNVILAGVGAWMTRKVLRY
jgi:lipopolysaccharide export system permease protein